jgi:hypothetical protein
MKLKLSVSAKTLRIAAVVALLALIAAMIYIGCGCRVGWTRETFADAAAAAEAEAEAAAAAAGGADGETEEDSAARVGHVADDGAESYADDDDMPAAKKPLVATAKKDSETVGEATKREIEELILTAPGAVKKAPAPTKSIVAGARDTGDLSKREADLFEDLKTNKLSEKEVINLVKTGVLNEALVEKFLSKLDSTAAQLALEDERMRGEIKRQPSLALDEATAKGSVEGFCDMAPGYAKW